MQEVAERRWRGAILTGLAATGVLFGCGGSDPVGSTGLRTSGGPDLEYRVQGLIFASGVVSTANDINNEGVVVGVISDRAVRWVLGDGVRYTGPFELELAGGGDPGPSEAMGVNDAGQVVGVLGGDTLRPFIWTEAGGLRPLPLPPGASSGVAYDINTDGQIVGSTSADPAFEDEEAGHVALWTVDSTGAALDVVDLGTLGGTGAKGHAINEVGQLAGTIWYEGGASRTSFVWYPTTDFETLPLQGQSLGMNSRGAVVGSLDGQAAVWRAGEIEAVGPAGTVARAINDDELIVGEEPPTRPGGSGVGFVISTGQLHVLEVLSSVEYARPSAVNEAGIVVGDLFTSGPNISEAAFWVPR